MQFKMMSYLSSPILNMMQKYENKLRRKYLRAANVISAGWVDHRQNLHAHIHFLDPGFMADGVIELERLIPFVGVFPFAIFFLKCIIFVVEMTCNLHL